MSRFDALDTEQLTATGYQQTDISLKIRIIKVSSNHYTMQIDLSVEIPL